MDNEAGEVDEVGEDGGSDRSTKWAWTIATVSVEMGVEVDVVGMDGRRGG